MNIRTMVGALTMAVSFLSAQEVTPAIGAHSKALLFNFSGLNVLGANNYAGGIGAKFFLSPAMALRGGLQFGTTNTTLHSAIPIPVGLTEMEGSATSMNFGLNAALEMHMSPSRVSPYIGGLVGISSLSNETTPATIGAPPVAGGTTKNSVGSGAGMRLSAGGLCGIEFFLTKEISLSAEYMLGYSMVSPYDQEVTNAGTTTTTKGNSSWTINIATVGGLTLSVYF